MASDPATMERFRRFLFAPTDANAVGVLRISLACMLAWGFWSVGREGISGPTAPDLVGLYDQLFLTTGYWVVVLAVLGAFAVGVRPRLTGLLLVALLLPLTILDSGRQSRQVLIFALAAFSLLRSDARFSLRSLEGRGGSDSAGPVWPIRLMQIQLTVIYGVNALAKTSYGYLNGDILVGMSIMRPNFHVDLSGGYLHLGAIAIPAALAAISSVIVEYFLAVGFWIPRLRMATAAVGVLFHVGLAWIMSIFMLDTVTVFLYLVFLLPLASRDPRSWGSRASTGSNEPLSRSLSPT